MQNDHVVLQIIDIKILTDDILEKVLDISFIILVIYSFKNSRLERRIRKFLNLSWTVQVNHTLREGNRSADWLANYSILMDSINFNLLETPLNELRSLLFDDLSGACMPRNVMLVS